MARQLSQNELKTAKGKKEEIVVVYNISKQAISVQLMPPVNPKTGKKLGFFTAEQSIMVPRGKSARFPKGRLYMDQINNLQRSGMIRLKA